MPRHEFHLVLTVLTLGVWGVCWIITIIAARSEPWRCHECRRPQLDDEPGRRATPPAPAAVESPFEFAHGRGE